MRRVAGACAVVGASLLVARLCQTLWGCRAFLPGHGVVSLGRARSTRAALSLASARLGVPERWLVWESARAWPSSTRFWHPAMPDAPLLPPPYTHAVRVRPLRGDHYHQHLVFRVDGVQLPPWHDVAPLRGVAWETPSACNASYAYHSARGLHMGFHTHCDGVAHSHPWSAPSALRVAGARHTMGLLLDSRGAEFSRGALQLPGRAARPGELLICRDGLLVARFTAHLDRVWWPVHGDALVFSQPPGGDCNVTLARLPASHGFDAFPYP